MILQPQKFSEKNFWWKFLIKTCFWGNDFATIKNFQQNNFWWIFLIKTCFRGNDFGTIKNFRPKNFLWKFLAGSCFRGNDFATKKNLDQKNLIYIFGRNLFSRKWFCNHKKFWIQKCYSNKFSCKPVFEEMILKP